MSDFDWTRFKRSVFIDSSLDEVFNAWITQDQIETWFLKKAVFNQSDGQQRDRHEQIESGDSYSWNWWNYDETEHGKVLLVDRAQRRLEFSFAGECTCIVTVTEEQGDILLTVEQKDIPIDEASKRNIHIGCGQGWAFWMVNLKSWLEHGVLLHDQESKHRTADFDFCELINR